MLPKRPTKRTVSVNDVQIVQCLISDPVDRVDWFRTALDGSTGSLTDEEMHVLAER